jgi:hypothetical protein
MRRAYHSILIMPPRQANAQFWRCQGKLVLGNVHLLYYVHSSIASCFIFGVAFHVCLSLSFDDLARIEVVSL